MATQQIVNNFKYNGGYLDAGMSVQTIEELQGLSRNSLFTGRTVTVVSAIVTEGGKSIPADFWLSEGKTKSCWTLKDIAPIDDISQMSSIPSDYIPNGFEVVTKSGEKYKFDTTVESGEPKWEKYTYEGGDVNVDGMSEDLANTIFSGVDRLYGNALNFVQSAVGTQQQNTQQATTALQNAYNSTQASINNFKTYALYATIGFIAWAYFRGK